MKIDGALYKRISAFCEAKVVPLLHGPWILFVLHESLWETEHGVITDIS